MILKLFTVVYTALNGWAPTSTVLSSGVSTPPKGHVERVFPDERTFLLNVPEAYEHGVPHALVLSFHGAGGNSSKQERITQLSDPSLRLNGLPILSAYPQGVNNTDWNFTHIWQGAPYGNASVDDVRASLPPQHHSIFSFGIEGVRADAQVGYTKSIIADISHNYTVDPQRIYISGKSNGGGFTALSACHPELSTLFAAFSPVSPALYPLTGAFGGLLCNPARVVPVLHSHGIEDTDTPFHGRRPGECGLGPEPDVRDWRREWAERNRANERSRGRTEGGEQGEGPQAAVDQPFEDVTRTTWSGEGWEVVGLSIEKLGHAWPSTEGLDLAGFPNQTATFEFTKDVLIPFFDRHVLPKEYVRRA